MLAVRPKTISDGALSSSVNDALDTWNSTSIYALAAQVMSGLIVNGNFGSGTTGWAPGNGATLSSVGGRLRVTSTGSYGPSALQVVATVVGQTYGFTARSFAGTTTSRHIRLGTTSGGTEYLLVTNGDADFSFVATTTTTYITLLINDSVAAQYAEFDYINLASAAGATSHRIYESLSGGTSAAVTMTIASPCVVSWLAHGLGANTPITFTTTGALPTGLAVGTTYYVLSPTTNTFNVSATPGGAAINTSGSQSGTHTAIANPNLNKALTNPAFWLDIGPTNKWAMFDSKVGTATTDASLIDVTAMPAGLTDAVALVGLANADSARIVVTDAVDGVVYDQSFSLTSTLGITSWYAWFFEEIKRKALLLTKGLPPYFSPSIRLIITGGGGANVGCGLALFGQIKELGETDRDGAEIGITDYSRVTIDDFGEYSITPRDYAKRGIFHSYIARGDIDGIEKILGDLRATPTVFSATDSYESMQIFALVKNFSIVPIDGDEALLTLELQGLT